MVLFFQTFEGFASDPPLPKNQIENDHALLRRPAVQRALSALVEAEPGPAEMLGMLPPQHCHITNGLQGGLPPPARQSLKRRTRRRRSPLSTTGRGRHTEGSALRTPPTPSLSTRHHRRAGLWQRRASQRALPSRQSPLLRQGGRKRASGCLRRRRKYLALSLIFVALIIGD